MKKTFVNQYSIEKYFCYLQIINLPEIQKSLKTKNKIK
jgi:hypothetical protein